MKFNKIFVVLAILLLLIILFLLPECNPEPKVVTVDCSKGDLLFDEVERANKRNVGTRINVTGECTENNPVVITRDNIIIVGQGQAETIIKGNAVDSVIKVEGAKNVIISKLTLTNGKNGIFIDDESSVVLNDIDVVGNTDIGIAIGSDVAVELPEIGDDIPNTVPDVEQNIDNAQQQSPATQILNKLDFSFMKSAVASSPVCPTVGEIIKNKNISGFIIDDIGTVYFCGTVRTNGRQIGVLVRDNSTLNIYGHLIRKNHLVGMLVAENSVVNIHSRGRVDTIINARFDVLMKKEETNRINIHSGGIYSPLNTKCYDNGLNLSNPNPDNNSLKLC